MTVVALTTTTARAALVADTIIDDDTASCRRRAPELPARACMRNRRFDARHVTHVPHRGGGR
jgi:hypothetical protein